MQRREAVDEAEFELLPCLGAVSWVRGVHARQHARASPATTRAAREAVKLYCSHWYDQYARCSKLEQVHVRMGAPHGRLCSPTHGLCFCTVLRQHSEGAPRANYELPWAAHAPAGCSRGTCSRMSSYSRMQLRSAHELCCHLRHAWDASCTAPTSLSGEISRALRHHGPAGTQ